jgi:hypothetical protein
MPVEYPEFVLEAAINSHEPEILGMVGSLIDDLPEQLTIAKARASNGSQRNILFTKAKPRFKKSRV